MHGERFLLVRLTRVPRGSSPRAWGTLSCPAGWDNLQRFIPTCMGNACSSRTISTVRSVHPHVHGERLRGADDPGGDGGSSPRAWGTRRPSVRSCRSRRFIPTCMGNAGARPAPPAGSAVHPHVHGERREGDGDRRTGLGSSPRAWGTP